MSVSATASVPANRFTGAVHVTLAVSLLGLWMSGTASIGAVLLLGAVLGWAMFRAHRGVVASERAEFFWNMAAVAYLMVYAADLFLLTHSLLGASLRLLIFLSVQRLMAARTDRDRLHLLLISFLAIVSATATTTEFTFALPMVLYLVAALRALACRQLDAAGVSLAQVPGPNRRMLIEWTAAILILGTIVFFLIPHLGTGYFRPTGGRRQNLSGFSGRIELGSINSIKKNRELALRVRLMEEAPKGIPLRWRGLAFDTYDGRAWSRSRTAMRHFGSPDGNFQLQPASGQDTLEYEILLEPLGTSVLFTAARPISIETNDFSHVFRDTADGLHRDRRRSRVRYQVRSELRSIEVLGNRLAGAGRDYPTNISDIYLGVPSTDPRVRQLSDQMAAGATDSLDIARRIHQRLRQDFSYTLDVNDVGVSDPLSRFLLDGAPGHCEYFATSMAILARMQGIPARVVVGFLEGEYSPQQRLYMVRQSDAHSWVEVYFPGHGWVGFDPTPPARAVSTTSLFARLRRAFEQAEIAWDTWIVGLDLNDQASLFGALREATVGAVQRFSDTLFGVLRSAGSMKRFAWGALALFLAAGLLAALRTLVPTLLARLRLWKPTRVRPDETDRLVEIYRRFLKALERRGVKRPATLTPFEFARQAATPSGRADDVREVTALFCRARYGGSGLTITEVHRIESLITLLRG